MMSHTNSPSGNVSGSARSRRLALALSVIAVAGCLTAGAYLAQWGPFAPPEVLVSNAKSTKRVLFVCVENSCRSQLAQAMVNIHGGGRVEAYSAGSRPSGVVNPKAIASMKELGYDLTTHVSKGLTAVPDLDFDAAITMGCGDACPMVRAQVREDWAIPDPKHMSPDEFREVRALIEAKVKTLLQRLEQG